MPDHQRIVVYCLLSPAAADALEDVREHYRQTDVRVEVIVDRRIRQRRKHALVHPHGPERRGGTDRRRFEVPRRLPVLPDELVERTGPVRYIQRMLPVGDATEALATEEVVHAVRAGDPEAPTELYWRFYERVHSRLCVLFGDPRDADATVVTAFGRVLDALDDDARAGEAFETLLYEQVDEAAREVLDRRGGVKDLPDGGLAVQDPELDEAVRVVAADPHWAARARSERDRLLAALGDHVVAIEHIGGTSIPNVGARNTVDLLAGVPAAPLDEPALLELDGLGYEDCGDAGAPGRLYLRRRGRTRVDLHVVEYGGALWHDALMLRDYLRRHPGEALRWATVKRDAARTSPTSAVRYYDLRRLALDELLDRARRDAVPRAA